MVKAFKNIRRLIFIFRTLGKYNVLSLLKEAGISNNILNVFVLISKKNLKYNPGKRLAMALEELGPTFIKLGQALSTRSDICGEEIASELSKLQDKLPAFSKENVKDIIESEMGKPIEECFTEFNWEAVAAASIAQVHFAITLEGCEVAVKVLRPNIEKAFKKDIDLFYWIAQLIENTQQDLRRLKPFEIIETFETTIHQEMDLRFEAAAAGELAENFIDDQDFGVPEVDWSLTSKRILTLKRVDGISIGDTALIKRAGLDPDEILSKAATALFKQVFRDGFFHADQHPGNIFVSKEGKIIAIDFGIMGRLDIKTRYYLGQMLLSFLNRDYTRVAELHFEAGYVPSNKSVRSFAQACRSIAEPILGKPQNEISIARLLGYLFQVSKDFQMEVQPQLLLLQKTMLTAEGVGRKLSPKANIWLLAQPLIEHWVENDLNKESIFIQSTKEIADKIKSLPKTLSLLEKNIKTLSREGLKIHPNSLKEFQRKNSRKASFEKLILCFLLFSLASWGYFIYVIL